MRRVDGNRGKTRVLLLVETSRAVGRGLLSGIATYVKAHRGWLVFHYERSLGDEAPPWIRDWKGDGVIARLETRGLVDAIGHLNLPTVDLRCRHKVPGILAIGTNQAAVAKFAAVHLFERGFDRFAYCGFAGVDYSEERLRWFKEEVAARGFQVLTYSLMHGPDALDTSAREAEGLLSQDALVEWLRKLPKPIGLFACNDICGHQVLNSCREAGIAVPDEIAVLGVDNDATLCDLAAPSLSSVAIDSARIGFLAATWLDRMIRGESPPLQMQFVEPLGIETRQSTDVIKVDDSRVATALRYIRAHACDAITVEDVANAAAAGRRTLERRFAASLGHSVHAEIVRVRLARVRLLLSETEYPISKVAELTGFGNPEYLNVLFRRETGHTPGEYRRSQLSVRHLLPSGIGVDL